MTVTRRGSRRAAPVIETPVESESENIDMSTDTLVADADVQAGTEQTTDTSAETSETPTEGATESKPKRTYKKPVEAIEARRRISEYKRAQEAQELLTGLGFTVTAPENWEHPDKANERIRAEKALQAYLNAGGKLEDLQPTS